MKFYLSRKRGKGRQDNPRSPASRKQASNSASVQVSDTLQTQFGLSTSEAENWLFEFKRAFKKEM